MEIEYFTRDTEGNDFVKKVNIKEFPIENTNFACPICNKIQHKGCKIKNIVSSKFTDWAYVGDYICPECSKLFSLYPYSYIVDSNEVRLLNVRQLRDELCRKQKTPFRFVISTTQKKHLFYRSAVNYNNDKIAVNLETETIYTSPERMIFLFGFIENLITLGASKKAMQNGEIPFNIVQKIGIETGLEAINVLTDELKNSREIQIPLFCGQKLNIREEDAICNLDFILKTGREQRRH